MNVDSNATNVESKEYPFVFVPISRDMKLIPEEADWSNNESVGDEQSSSRPSTTDAQGTRTNRTVSMQLSYYVDELGFYRHLDADQRQYVCSNLIDTRPPQNGSIQNLSASSRFTAIQKGSNRYISLTGDHDVGNPSRVIRDQLGISHFDRLDGYEEWKQAWDEFIKDKLLKREKVTFNQTLKSKVRTGIPHDYRRKVWTALIMMRTRKLRARFGYDIYDKLLRDCVCRNGVPNYNSVNKHEPERHRDQEENDTSSRSSVGAQKNLFNSDDNYNNRRAFEMSKQTAEKIFKQIELDLLRTLPNNRHFEDYNSIGVKRVRRVLRAYACFNPAVGYCQGMNRLAAMALLVLPEEEAFWCMVAIIQCIMPKDYYLKPWLAQVDCYVLAELLEKKMPKLHKHLVKNDIQLTLFTWFFTIYVDGFRPELMLRIWDCFLVEGDKVLFRVALAILHMAQDDLLGMHDTSHMYSYLSQLISTRKLDTELLFEIAFNKMNPLSNAKLDTRRAFHRDRMALTLDD